MTKGMTKAEMAELMTAQNAQMAAQAEQIEKLTALVNALSIKAQKQKPAKPWLAACPDYATAAQRVEYDKLAERAKAQRDDVVKLLGTESVSCFIPVAKEQARMPHSIKWTATYSK